MASASVKPLKPEVDEALVEAIEDLLNRAKEGELVSLSFTGDLKGGFLINGFAGVQKDRYALAGRLMSLIIDNLK